MEKKIIIVTGASRGIGKEIAKTLAKEGHTVIANYNKSEKEAQKLKEELKKENKEIEIYKADISKEEEIKKMVEYTIKKYKKIDILINNAGIRGGHIATVTEADYDMILDTNLKAVFFLSRLVGKYMKENKITGNILNIISSSGLRPATSAYTLSKWGVRGLTLGLAKSLIPYDIVVNGLAPGPTATPMLMKDGSEEIGHTSNPLGRYAMPEEIANMAVVLTSGMGRTVVGDIVYMTGGAGIITFDDMDYKF